MTTARTTPFGTVYKTTHEVSFAQLQGLTLTAIHVDHNDQIWFCSMLDDRTFLMEHTQDCCESVVIDDICGDINDLLFTPILMAEERTSDGEEYRKANNHPPLERYSDSETWTFYELRTHKGSVTLRWCGSSNGYYSESVAFRECFAR